MPQVPRYFQETWQKEKKESKYVFQFVGHNNELSDTQENT